MKYKYRKYEPDEFEGVDLADLVSKLSDLLLASGFQNPWDPDDDSGQTMQALHDAILDALLNDAMIDPESMSTEQLESLFNLDYHLKEVDTIFSRVFGTA